MDNKGMAEHMGLWIFRAIFLGFVVIMVFLFLKTVVVLYQDTSAAKAYVYMNKILYDKNGIILYENDRAYPGVIDFKKFTGANLDKAFIVDTSKEGPTAKLYLVSIDYKEKHTIYWNEKWFERLQPKFFFRGMGGVTSLKETLYVNVYKDNKFQPGLLTIEVLVPR